MFETFNQMLAWFEVREASNNTTDALIDGPRGNGKSNDVLLMMNQLQPGFPFNVHYVYDAVDLARIIPATQGMKNLKLWFDEAKNLVYRRNAMTRVNKAISGMMTQIREMKGTRFWVSPDTEELEGFLTKDQADVCLTAVERGTLTAWKFWKNHHAPPGKREGRWAKVFTKTGIPNMAEAKPSLEREYRQHKSAGYERVTMGYVEKILMKETRSLRSMSTGLRDGIPSPKFPYGQPSLREPDPQSE